METTTGCKLQQSLCLQSHTHTHTHSHTHTHRNCKPAAGLLKQAAEKSPTAAVLQEGHELFFRGHYQHSLWKYLQVRGSGTCVFGNWSTKWHASIHLFGVLRYVSMNCGGICSCEGWQKLKSWLEDIIACVQCLQINVC